MKDQSKELPGRRDVVLATLGVALATGLATGLVHGTALFVSHRVFGGITFQSRDFTWMAPLSYAALFLGIGIVFAVVALIRPRLVPTWAVAGFFVFFGVFGLMLPIDQVSKYASCILALGVAVQAARVMRPSSGRLGGHAWRGVALLATVVVAIWAAGDWRTRTARDRALATLPESEDGSPNVLLLILDTVRASSLSLYGSQLATTPLLDGWAAQGATFNWAMSTGPWTLPSHATMFTGQYPAETDASWTRPLPDSLPVLAEIFRDRGYLTVGVVANQDYAAWDSGLARGFYQFDDFVRGAGELRLSNAWMQTEFMGRLWGARRPVQLWNAFREFDLDLEVTRQNRPRRADMVVDGFLEAQAAHPDRPFFAFLNFFDAHAPYYSPAEFKTIDAGDDLRSEYHNAIRWIDFSVDRLFNELNSRGVLDNTIVIITSDHGEMINERNFTGHAYYLYQHLLHVPLIIRFPRAVPAATRIDRAVSLRDLPATVLDLAAISDSRIPGSSLVPVWRDSTVQLSPVFAEVARVPNIAPRFPTSRGALDAIFDEELHLIRGPGDSVEVYRYRTDSLELAPIPASDTVAAPGISSLKRLVESIRKVPGAGAK